MHELKHHSPLKKEEILQYATTCTELEDVLLSEIGQSQKDRYCRTHLHKVSKPAQLIEAKKTVVAARCWGRGNAGLLINWHKIPDMFDDKV